MYEYQQIIYHLRQGQSARAIARDGLGARNTIAVIQKIAQQNGWLSPTVSMPDESVLREIFNQKTQNAMNTSKVMPHGNLVKQWVEQDVQATTILARLIENYGFEGSYSSLLRYIDTIKSRQDVELTVPLHFKPGEAAQVDFGKGPRIFDERTQQEEDTWFFVMTLCWSRHQYAEIMTHQDIETWLNCHQNAFYWFRGIVIKIIIDNAKCAITKACYYDPETQKAYGIFAQAYGFIISACPPREPKKKGRVESGVKYIKKNFLPLRQFKNIKDANDQLKDWILSTAGNRNHGSTYEKPLTRFVEVESKLLKALPVTPPEIATWRKVTLYTNCHVLYLKCFYSVPHHLYGKELWIKVTATLVTVYCQDKIVAQHPRLFKEGTFSTLIEHMPEKAQAYLTQDKQWCLDQSKQFGKAVQQVIETFLTDKIQDRLHAAQGVIKLGKEFGKDRLEFACQRAIDFNAVAYRTIKDILKKGLDYQTQKETKPTEKQLSSVYKGQGCFQRSTQSISTTTNEEIPA